MGVLDLVIGWCAELSLISSIPGEVEAVGGLVEHDEVAG